MQSRIIVDSREESLLSTHKVLRNTYFLLALTLAFSAVVAYVSMAMNLPRPGLIIMLVGFYGLLFLTNALANSALGILSAFAFTGFLGYKKDMSFLSGTILALFVVLLLGMVASFFFQFPALYVGISALFVIFSTMGILYETSNIIHGGETNYIRATVSLFVSIYNLFISLLNLLSFFSSRD